MSASDPIGLSRRSLLARIAAAPPVPSEAEVLSSLLNLERLAAASAELALESGALTSLPAVAVVATIHAQEGAHAAALARWPGVVAAPDLFGKGLAPALAAVGIKLRPRRLRDESDWLAFLEIVETVLEGAYYVALAQLVAPAAATLAATILGSEAQHRALLSFQRYPLALGYAVPSGLVRGTPPPAPRP